jgi:hypothetical protein
MKDGSDSLSGTKSCGVVAREQRETTIESCPVLGHIKNISEGGGITP